jgi:hypothetical protein
VSAIQDLTVGEIIGWVMLFSGIIGFIWKGVPLLRKVSRFVDAMVGYTDADGKRHPGLIEQVAALVEEVKGLKTAVRTAATRLELEEVRRDIAELDDKIRRHHPEELNDLHTG